jgi:hypothetical protein
VTGSDSRAPGEAAEAVTKPPASPNAYRIVEAGVGYHVVQSFPDGSGPRVLAAFITRAAATEWLADLLGIPRPPEGWSGIYQKNANSSEQCLAPERDGGRELIQ